MTARFLIGDVFDRLAELEDGSVDLVVTSPPFLALRSYLPADHPDKPKEIGSEATPAAFLDVMLAVMAELRRVTAEHGSVCIELGDTYAGSGGAGGDYDPEGLREGQPKFRQARFQPASVRNGPDGGGSFGMADRNGAGGGGGWPLAKSRALIPELFRIALAYGINPLTGQESPAGKWLIRNVVTWCRPNPPVGALGDKWRPATSDVVVACTSAKRYWDDLATRKPVSELTMKVHGKTLRGELGGLNGPKAESATDANRPFERQAFTHSGAPLLDYWVIPPGGYSGSHYAVYPPALVEPLVKAMCPSKVCLVCGEPSRRITENNGESYRQQVNGVQHGERLGVGPTGTGHLNRSQIETLGWSDCGHDSYRPGLILDPFAGSGTTLLVATGHGHDAIGIDLDERNAAQALDRVGPFLLEIDVLASRQGGPGMSETLTKANPWGTNNPMPLMNEDSDWYAFPKTFTKRQVVSEMLHNYADWWIDENTILNDDDTRSGWFAAIRSMFNCVEESRSRPSREDEYGFGDDWWYEDNAGEVECWIVRL